jgi:predicted membrane channel-forming protein YqfA (hemolysin III family)
MSAPEEHLSEARGVLIVSLVLATFCALVPWLFRDPEPYWWMSMFLWMASVIVCFCVNVRFGRWALLGVPIALSFFLFALVSCAFGVDCL